jgi:hypothetical protein
MQRVIHRDEVITAFAPVVPLLRGIIVRGRNDASADVVAAAHPRLRSIGRVGHIRRIAGTLRWLYIAEDLVLELAVGPTGFSVLSSDADHSQGRFVFRFPGGVFTVRRQPHTDKDENVYIQECLREVLEQAALADGVDGSADLTIYIGIGAEGLPKLHVAHPTLKDPMMITLDEFDAPREMLPGAGPSYRKRSVTSEHRPAQTDQDEPEQDSTS